MNRNEQMIREQAYQAVGPRERAGQSEATNSSSLARSKFERGETYLSAHVPPHVEAVSSWIER